MRAPRPSSSSAMDTQDRVGKTLNCSSGGPETDCARENRHRELMVRVEDVRLAVTSQGILQCFDAECRLHCDRYAPRQHATTEPVEHNGEINEATGHRNVRDVHRPHLVEPDNLHSAQQVQIDAAGTDRSCAQARAASCADGDRAPLSPSASSAYSRDAVRPCTPRQPTGLATFASRRRENLDVTGRGGA
jgi:hypothetical protein